MPAATQADFDEAVRVNMVDFDMGGAEAVAAAVEELELQVRFFFLRASEWEGAGGPAPPAADTHGRHALTRTYTHTRTHHRAWT
jgi:hypothetical protein